MNTTDRTMNSHEQTEGSHWVNSLWFRILLITSLGLGIFFRVAGLGNKIYSHDEALASLRSAGYRGGEAFTSLWDGTDKTVEDLQRFLKPGEDKTITDTLFITASSGPHQGPLFYLLAHYWMRIIGYTPAAMRGLAAAFGILSILAMYWLGRELFQSTPIALLSTTLFAISPFHILFAQDARPYSLWTLATLLSSATFLRAIRKSSVSTWLMYSLTLLLGMYSHQLFIFVALVHGFYFVALYLLNHIREYRGFLLASLLAFLAYTPWLIAVITYWDRAVESMDWVNQQIPGQRYVQKWAVIFGSPFMDFDLDSGNLLPYLLRAFILVLIAYGFVFLVLHGSQQEKMFLLPMCILSAGAFIVPDLLLGGMRSIGGRYFVPVNIATILVVASFLANHLDRADFRTNTKSRLLIGSLIVASILSNVNSLQAETWWNKELGRVWPDFVHEIDKDQALLIVSNGSNGTTIGDVLLLSLEVDSDVHFRVYQNPEDIEYPNNYDYVYWFPRSNEEVQKISEKEGFQVRKILENTLWQIEGKLE